MEDKVSIITPAYNSESYILETIESVVNQTYQNWEMIIVDDCSNDNTRSIIKNAMKDDKRIKLIPLDTNSGAAVARNTGLKASKGRFIAYLDADDLWYPQKLEKQTSFMLEKKICFSCTSYEVIDNEGVDKGKYVYMKDSLNYQGFLTNNLIQTVGVMVDLSYISKDVLKMPNMRRRQDAATWLQILKNGKKCYGITEVLAKYRRTDASLSSNKFKAVTGVWYLYRKVEKLPLWFALYCFGRYAFLAVWKRVYIKKMLRGEKDV